MPTTLTLSNGQTVISTGETDARGYPILIGVDGSVYTNQNGRIILGRPGTALSPQQRAEISGLLKTAGLGEYQPVVEASATEMSTLLPTAQPTPRLSEFKEEAQHLTGPWFDKELELLRKEIDLEKKQAEEDKTLGLERYAEDQETFTAKSDVGFARALAEAQAGFSGRGTYISGFRHKAISELGENVEEERKQKYREFYRGREDLTRGFEQFYEKAELAGEKGELKVERERKTAELTAQQKLLAEEQAARSTLSDTLAA